MTDKINVDLTSKDTWDDSLLIKDWEQRLQEYKKYHSLKRKADALEDPNEGMQDNAQTETNQGNAIEEASENNAFDDISDKQPEAEEDHLVADQSAEDSEAAVMHDSNLQSGTDTGPSPPIPINELDPETRKLVMAWYWAGYYHGLYVGKSKCQG